MSAPLTWSSRSAHPTAARLSFRPSKLHLVVESTSSKIDPSHDYIPLDLSDHCNEGTAQLPSAWRKGSGEYDSLPFDNDIPIGEQNFHGLPFQIGPKIPTPECCFLGFGAIDASNQARVIIPVRQQARKIIFAHSLLESDLYSGGPLGEVVANYSLRFADGEQLRVPIRERFEIAALPTPWGGFPFLAVPDRNEELMPRSAGEWGLLGARQIGAYRLDPRSYWLWAWPNPRPEKVIESIIIEPNGRRFIVAAITLGQADEPPFYRTGKREVIITLPQLDDARQPFDLEVEVDRGVATYPFPLPQQSAEEYLAADFSGWGESQNESASPAYIEIAAIPSATVTVKNHGRTLGAVQWGELEEKHVVAQPGLRLEVVDRGKNWVHVTTLDDETGQPIPCRVHFRSPEGIPYQPHGYHNHVNSNLNSWHIDVGGDLRLGQITYAYIDGKCQGWLPRGELIVDVARGFEYEPMRTRMHIQPGQRELILRLKRWTNMNAQRWFSGDSHVHFLGAQGAHREAQGEDLNVVQPFTVAVGSLIYEYRGLHWPAHHIRRRQHHRLLLARKPPALTGSSQFIGVERASHALGHRRYGRR